MNNFEYGAITTVRAAIPGDKGNLLLVHRHVRHDNNANLWEMPGGKINDPAEPPEVALKRRVLEETGLEIKVMSPLRTVERRTMRDPAMYDQFYIVHTALAHIIGGELRLGESHDEAGWQPHNQPIKLPLTLAASVAISFYNLDKF
ncbi:hypothetical protein BH10PAT3_BH10PAT3_8780 [soil metagenome]